MNRLVIIVAAALGASAAFCVGGSWVYEGQWGEEGSGPGKFTWPLAVDVAPNGNVYVGDDESDIESDVQYFTATGSFLGKWNARWFGEMSGVAVNPGGTRVYTSDRTWDYEIKYWTPAGSLINSWGYYPHLYYSGGLDIAAKGNVYVTDAGNNKIQCFTTSGSLIRTWSNGFTSPQGIAVAPNGNVYVTDIGGHQVRYFTAAGSFLGAWGSQGSGEGQFNRPEDVDVGPGGDVYVADTYNHRVQYFTSAGSYLGEWGQRGSGPGDFEYASALSLSVDGRRVYVVDTGNCRIQYFRRTENSVVPSSLGSVKALFKY